MKYLRVAAPIMMDRRRPVWGRPGRIRADANARELDDLFLAWGCSLLVLDHAGDSIPDRLVGVAGLDCLVEYKAPKGRIRPGQAVFARFWRGRRDMARDRADVMRIVGELRALATRLGLDVPAAPGV